MAKVAPIGVMEGSMLLVGYIAQTDNAVAAMGRGISAQLDELFMGQASHVI